MRTPIKEDKQKISVFSIAIVITALAGLMAISITTSALTANAQVPGMTTQQGSTSGGSSGEEQQQSDTVTIQKTAESTVDPAPGHSGHQVVMALPPRDDGKVWVGTVTWTASKPVEIVVLQGYNSTVKPDSEHGSPLTAPIGPGKEVAISLVKTSSGTPVPSGSMTFVGNVVGFHTLNGDKFTVTYTLDAVAKQLTQ